MNVLTAGDERIIRVTVLIRLTVITRLRRLLLVSTSWIAEETGHCG